jgi:hypothetical protein
MSPSPPDSAQLSSDDEDFEEANISEKGKEDATDTSSPPILAGKTSEGDTLSVDEIYKIIHSTDWV